MEVRSWGAMREVLREGHTEGRVTLADVVGPDTIAVGAVAGLAGEITIVSGNAQVAVVVDAAAPDGLQVRPPSAGEQATLLVLADVPTWTEHTLPAVHDLGELERLVRTMAAEQGLRVTLPFPFRVEGTAGVVQLHALDRSCPIAHPEGPPPWRYAGTNQALILVGFHADDAAGRLTHHGQSSHTHAMLPGAGVSGHLDHVALAAGARLYLPASG